MVKAYATANKRMFVGFIPLVMQLGEFFSENLFKIWLFIVAMNELSEDDQYGDESNRGMTAPFALVVVC